MQCQVVNATSLGGTCLSRTSRNSTAVAPSSLVSVGLLRLIMVYHYLHGIRCRIRAYALQAIVGATIACSAYTGRESRRIAATIAPCIRPIVVAMDNGHGSRPVQLRVRTVRGRLGIYVTSHSRPV